MSPVADELGSIIVGEFRQPSDPGFEDRVRATFARQRLMETLRARLVRVVPGEVDIEASFDESLTQQDGLLHGGVVTALADSACCCAMLTLSSAGTEVVTGAYTVNFLLPAQGERFIARGHVVRAGRMLSVCSAEVEAIQGSSRTKAAVMLATVAIR